MMRADFTSHDYATHTHDAFVVAVTEQGGARIRSRGVAETAEPSRLFVSNPDEPQSSAMGGSARWTYRSFYLMLPAIEFLVRDLGIKGVPYFATNMVTDAYLVQRLYTLHCTLEEGSDRFREHELVTCVFGSLFARHGCGCPPVPSAPRDPTAVRQIIEMMRAHHAERLLLKDLADDFDISVFQLIGAFKDSVGITPHVALTHIRMNSACRLLKRGTPIAEAATASGFADQSALTKNFKRAYGITPLQYARASGAKLSARRARSGGAVD
jgi:AraC-like DNA-binding protein